MALTGKNLHNKCIKPQTSTILASAETLKAITRVMYQMYPDDTAPRISSRPDDPQKTADDDRLHVRTVVFSDFACGHCRQFAEAVEQQFNPLFDNHLEIVFKHFPLGSDCNPRIRTDDNPHSCRAARAASSESPCDSPSSTVTSETFPPASMTKRSRTAPSALKRRAMAG